MKRKGFTLIELLVVIA
ncbi:MAG: hypothetical protein COZ57_20225, partial [Armatimonadetes bacterium CG_4_8_14_3_um_filter_66_20]